jgi:hypothetical protein
MTHLKAFVAGFVSTLVFHQGLLALFALGGIIPFWPWNLTPVPPLGVPSVISLAFWGGLWGIVLWLLIGRSQGAKHWWSAAIVGALGPSLVAWFVVMPAKGMGVAGNFDPKIIVGALMVNAVWGIGVAILMRAFPRIGWR